MAHSLLAKRNLNLAVSIIVALAAVGYQVYSKGSWQLALQPAPSPTPAASPVAALIQTASQSGEVAGVTTTSNATNLETATVKKVVDGDTIQLTDGRKVRYIGMDTPESVDPRRPVECFGKEASARNTELVGGKTIQLEKDVSETDKYGRLLRYVYVNGQLINQELVEEGFARSVTYPPDVKYQTTFNEAEKQARADNKGLWGSDCVNTLPKSFLK